MHIFELLDFWVVALWRCVAMCGDTKTIKKSQKMHIFELLDFGVVALWRWVAMCGDTKTIKKSKTCIF